jgi:hypothetical protein
MARTTIAPQALSGKWPTALSALTFTACDASNGNQCKLTGSELLVAFNSHASTAYTLAVSAVPDPVTNRDGDISATSIAAGAFKMIGPLAPEGWRQSDGYLYFDAENAAVKVAVIKLNQ